MRMFNSYPSKREIFISCFPTFIYKVQLRKFTLKV